MIEVRHHGDRDRWRLLYIFVGQYVLTTLLLFLRFCFRVCCPGHSDKRAKRVLIINPYNVTYPPESQRISRCGSTAHREIVGEAGFAHQFIDLTRFPEENQEHLAARYLAEKYAGMNPDVVVTGRPRASELCPEISRCNRSRHSARPVLLDHRCIHRFPQISDVTGTISTRDITNPRIGGATSARPHRHLVVIAGAAKFRHGNGYRIARQQIESRDRKFGDTSYLVGVPTRQLIRDVSGDYRVTQLS